MHKGGGEVARRQLLSRKWNESSIEGRLIKHASKHI